MVKRVKQKRWCGASMDGETSIHPKCPQDQDGEPAKSGRSCPLPHPRGISDGGDRGE